MSSDDVSALGQTAAETRGEGTTVSDIDVMRLAVEGLADCEPRARLAAVDWLHQRVRSDVRQGVGGGGRGLLVLPWGPVVLSALARRR